MQTDTGDPSRNGDAFNRAAQDIAHSFNNLMTAVIGYADMLLSRHAAPDQDRTDLLEIQRAGRRGAVLAQELRAVSCAVQLELADTDLNQMVGSVHRLVRGLIEDDISITCDVDEHRAAARLDPHQVEQALVNLVLNAQEVITRGRIHLDVSIVPAVSPVDGASVRLRIAGSAAQLESAVSQSMLPRDPGPGLLNLTASYAIIQRNGGTLAVERRAEAVVFTVSFPALADADVPIASHIIVVVDDDDAVRRLLGRMLRVLGYRVLETPSAASARQLFDDQGDDVALIIADVHLRDTNGVDLVRQLVRKRPGLRALLMTGDRQHAIAGFNDGESAAGFLHKPFTEASIVQAVHRALCMGEPS